MSWKRAYVVACFASLGQICRQFQSSVARFTGYSVRTVQRAARQAKTMGVLVPAGYGAASVPRGSAAHHLRRSTPPLRGLGQAESPGDGAPSAVRAPRPLAP